MEVADVVTPWNTSLPVTGRSSLKDMCRALAMVGADDAFNEIGELLEKRGCKTPDDWEGWLKGEFTSLVRNSTIKLKKHRNAYLKALEAMCGRTLVVERAGVKSESDDPFAKVKKASGGDTTLLSTKVAPSSDFNARQWQPDARVYNGISTWGRAEFMDDEEEKLYLDRLYLAAQVDAPCARAPCPHSPLCPKLTHMALPLTP